MKPIRETISEKPWVGWLIFLGTVVVVFFIGLFASSIVERRSEALTLQQVEPIAEWEPRNEVWGENYPREYETYLKTLDTNFSSKYAGSAWRDYLEEAPELVVMWAGYGFAKEYNQARGHAYAIEDIREILRTGGEEVRPMPATCWTCKSTDVPRLMAENGVAEFYDGNWYDKGHDVVNPIGCQDCHDPKTMNLRITRPALVEAFERQGKSMEDFSHNEMRSLVCAQCHVEYYFDKAGHDGVPYLTFPWDEGFSAEEMEEYYDKIDFVDWTHKLSKTPMLKAQHPDYELFMTGTHAEHGVSCADCHMPYKTEGGVKFTDHHIQSPLNNISNSCFNCHQNETEKLIKMVYSRQDRIMELRRLLEESLAGAHIEAKTAWDNGAVQREMDDAQQLIREAQWRWDWVAAANGVGFHSPDEALRVLGTGLQKAEQARKELALVLVKHGVEYPIDMPDISTKAKAQEYVGLNMEMLRADKEELLENTIPKWDSLATERQGSLNKYEY